MSCYPYFMVQQDILEKSEKKWLVQSARVRQELIKETRLCNRPAELAFIKGNFKDGALTLGSHETCYLELFFAQLSSQCLIIFSYLKGQNQSFYIVGTHTQTRHNCDQCKSDHISHQAKIIN